MIIPSNTWSNVPLCKHSIQQNKHRLEDQRHNRHFWPCHLYKHFPHLLNQRRKTLWRMRVSVLMFGWRRGGGGDKAASSPQGHKCHKASSISPSARPISAHYCSTLLSTSFKPHIPLINTHRWVHVRQDRAPSVPQLCVVTPPPPTSTTTTTAISR